MPQARPVMVERMAYVTHSNKAALFPSQASNDSRFGQGPSGR